MRAAGVLLPVFSLPSPYGIGALGAAAHAFVEFLEAADQRYWQILPLGPTGYGDSPYQAFSSFAGNPYLIDLDALAAQGLLTREECDARDFGRDPGRVDYLRQYRSRQDLLRRAFARFPAQDGAFGAFAADQSWWLEDYALYTSLKSAQGDAAWDRWPEQYRLRDPAAMEAYAAVHEEDIRFHKFVQYLFYGQWRDLKRYANAHGIRIIGDIPIYAAPDSADVWADPRLFLLDERGRPTQVAGVPPDAFSADGQLWGNPLYNWEVHRQTGYGWWLRRLRLSAELYDMVRIDHFRGFESYYAIPAGDPTAAGGVWHRGPGMDFIGRVKAELPDFPILAENLGFLTPEVHRLLEDSGFPGMAVLQFAFGGGGDSEYLPHNHRRRMVVYTGTHDNTTSAHWPQAAPPEEAAFAREYLGLAPDGDFADGLVRAALASVCDLAVVPLQDYLGLGAQARINTPSTLGGNWTWRLTPGQATPELAARMARLVRIYGR